MVQIIVFSILYSYFEVVVHGTGAQYFFFVSLTFKLWKKCVMNIINVLDIILKKYRTWTLKHSCKDPNHNFFLILCSYFEVVVHGTGARYLFLNSLMFKL